MTKTTNPDILKIQKLLCNFVNSGTELYEACKMQQRLIGDMMPGVANIALPDYALLNDAQIAASQAIEHMETTVFEAGKELGKCQQPPKP